MAGVLIPTFGNVIEKANANAAYQEARNAWTQYLTSVDYATETAEEDLLIVVAEGKYYVQVTDGKIAEKAIKVDEKIATDTDDIKKAIPTGFTDLLLDLDGNENVEGVFGVTK